MQGKLEMRRLTCRLLLSHLALLGASLFLVSCSRGCPSEKPPIHLNPNMDVQPKYRPQAKSGFFYNGAAMREPVAGTVARGELREDEELYTGRSPWGVFLPESPHAVDEEFILRGKERYQIYCTPCHDGFAHCRALLRNRLST